MNNRPQFTVRVLLIWTTILAVGIVLLKLVYDLAMSRQLSGAAETALFLPVSVVSRFDPLGIFVVLVGMLIMLAAMTSKNSRTSSIGLFLLVTTVCWGAVSADENPQFSSNLLKLKAMTACSAACFIETYCRIRSDNPAIHLDTARLYMLSITSVIVVVATKLCWGTGIMMSKI